MQGVSESGSTYTDRLKSRDYNPPTYKQPDIKGFELGLNTEKQELVIESDTPHPGAKTFNAVLERMGYDPTHFKVEHDRVEHRSWDMVVGPNDVRTMHYVKARIVKRIPEQDITKFLSRVKKYRKPTKPSPEGDYGLSVFIADPQVGKGEGGGVEELARRFGRLQQQVVDLVREYRKIGKPVGHIAVVGVGDIIENCSNWYPGQNFQIELGLTDQVDMAVDVILETIRVWVPLAERFTIADTPGNHGEHRAEKGQIATDDADNFDRLVFRTLWRVMRERPDLWGHVNWANPYDDLCTVYDIDGVIFGLSHGHLGGKSRPANIAKRQLEFWANQKLDDRPLAAADIFVTAHYHHFLNAEHGGKYWYQCPTMDGGSAYFAANSGQQSVPGVLTLLTHPRMTRPQIRILDLV
jgi:hypothetical protein